MVGVLAALPHKERGVCLLSKEDQKLGIICAGLAAALGRRGPGLGGGGEAQEFCLVALPSYPS